MKTSTALFCLAALSTMNQNPALAHCLDDDWAVLHRNISNIGQCQTKDALALATKDMSYPLMSHGPYRVEYWKGSFARTITTSVEYLHLITNRCNASEVLSEHVTKKEKNEVTFSIENPNLQDTVKATYDLVPMTDDEAKAALATARQSCEEYQP